MRPLLDEVNPDDKPSHALILRWLDSDLLEATRTRALVGSELKLVAKSLLEVLKVLHADGYVHTGKPTPRLITYKSSVTEHGTDVKPSNILVNISPATQKVVEAQLADLGSTLSHESKYAKEGHMVGTPIFAAPEVMLSMHWSTSADIWSLGTTVRSRKLK